MIMNRSECITLDLIKMAIIFHQPPLNGIKTSLSLKFQFKWSVRVINLIL